MSSGWNKNNQRSFFKKKQPQVNLALTRNASSFDNNPKYGYYGFKLYFPDENDIDIETTIKNVKTFENFIKNNETKYDLPNIEVTSVFNIEYNDLISNSAELSDKWRNFQEEITNNTLFCLSCMGLAMHQTIAEKTVDTEHQKNPSRIHAIILNFEPIQDLKDVRSNFFGKLTSVRGTIIKAGNVKILCEYMAFSCFTCRGEQVVKQPEYCLTFPTNCSTEGCRARSNFTALYSSPYTLTFEFQTIKIQELVGSEERETGRVPRTLDCQLSHSLVNSCVPGDDITITGVVQVYNTDNSCNKKQNAALPLYLHAIAITNNKNHSQGSYGASDRIAFSPKDFRVVQKIHEEPDVFRTLVHSLNPNIFGHEIVKAGLLLALFGGTKSEQGRAESHVLVVGDPGLGKSQMLQSCCSVAPRGVYVCGNTTTSSGLTVTMVREVGGDYSLEAGALVLADQGCCCIDEFDKMKSQHAALLEAMEQQSISMAKAGTVCSMPTRATILAAANPAGGHYDKAKTVAENLKISSPMLSRFDLVFILLDQPNQQQDHLMSEHILALHSKAASSSFLNMSAVEDEDLSENRLKKSLRLKPGEAIDNIPHSLLRKYIAYAQKYVNPQLSSEAKLVLKDFYIRLRKQYRTGDCTPITARQLNSLIRLTQARAKAELREIASEQDALDVIDILKECLVDVFTDDVGDLDTTRANMGSGMSSKNKAMKLLSLIQEKSESQGKSLFSRKEIFEMGERVAIDKTNCYKILESLNIQGFVLYKGGNQYQLVSTV